VIQVRHGLGLRTRTLLSSAAGRGLLGLLTTLRLLGLLTPALRHWLDLRRIDIESLQGLRETLRIRDHPQLLQRPLRVFDGLGGLGLILLFLSLLELLDSQDHASQTSDLFTGIRFRGFPGRVCYGCM
jgi:hypothetical protein